MTPAQTIDVGHLSRFNYGPQAPLWWGFIGILLIEATVFATLIASYFYLRMGEPHWPPAGVNEPELLLPTINAFLLIISSFFVHWADKSVNRNENWKLVTGLSAGVILAFIFLGLKVWEYSDVEYRWDSHAYGSIVWGITGFHSIHVLSLVLKTVVVILLGLRGYFNSQRRLGVTVNGLYWHFVVAVWIPLYFVLYWSPRLL